MANDRLWLACKVCRSRSPMLGKYWVGHFDWWADGAAMAAWIGEHWLMCGSGGGDNQPFLILDEDGEGALEKPEAK